MLVCLYACACVTDDACAQICICVCAISSTGGLSVCHLAAQEDEEAGGCFPL